MTTLVKILITLFLALFVSSCAFDVNFGNGKKGNGVVVEESRNVSEDFTSVHASEGIDVFVTQNDAFKISVEADENIIDLIGTDVKNGRLKIHAIENIGRATKKVYVSLPDVTALESSSGADLIAQNLIESERIELDASSGSEIQVELSAREVTADASSGADIKVSGTTQVLYADASSGSDIRAKNLFTKQCTADASSGADISVNVSESLIADASSGADISYTGDATVQTKKSVSGSVHKY
jgi:hypothetical protein